MAVLSTQHLSVTIGGDTAPLRLVKDRRAKCMRLSMNDRTREFRLTLPRWVSIKQGLAFVAERQTLLEKWWQALPAPAALADGGNLLWCGTNHLLRHDPAAGRRVIVTNGVIHIGGPEVLLPARLQRWMRAEAKAVLTRDTEALAARFQLPLAQVRVRDMHSRWGSCTSSGRISLCWRLIMAPEVVRTYVIAHELAHLTHMNHSDNFWREVTRIGGDLSARAWIKTHGAALMRF